MATEYDWLEFKVRPKKDGLHDSGYRFIQLTGVIMDEGEVFKEELHQWADHVLLKGITNIDVEPDGTIRLMCWGGRQKWVEEMPGFFGSSAMFVVTNLDAAIQGLKFEKQMRQELGGIDESG